MFPLKIFDKNGVIWCNLGRPKVCITNLKINNLKGKNRQENLIAIFLSQINENEHVSAKINTIRVYKAGSGWLAPRSRRIFFKKSNKMEAFPIFFAFRQGSLYPQNYELAP